MNLYVSNLGDDITSESLRAIFATHGAVSSYRVVRQQPAAMEKNFGFISMPDDAEARRAIRKINGMVVNGRLISVIEAGPEHANGGRITGDANRRR